MNSKEMSNKVKLEGEIIGDNKRISEALKEISSLEYVSWTLLADYAHFQNKNSLNIHIFYQTKELLNNNSLVIRRVINEKSKLYIL